MKQCPLCGYRFEESERMRCQACPLNKGCRLVCCPNCGYTFPEESRVFRSLKKWWKKKEKEITHAQ